MTQTAKAPAPGSPALHIQGHTPATAGILTPEAIGFLTELVTRFSSRRDELLELRRKRQAAFDAGTLPDFLPETKHVRDGDWKVAPIPPDLRDRRVEITGPVERKMIINALNSGASTFMADFEDSSSPTWEVMMDGQINIRDAVNGSITYDAPDGKHYALNPKPSVLLVRVRGWHLDEKHILHNGKPVPAALIDFGLTFFHNARALIAKSSGPYFYLPKMESYLEARLWNEIFVFAQGKLGLPQGTIRATALIETIPAAFQMDEILYELRDHAGGLNCGRWDYIFSFIKCFRNNPDFVLPDRGQVGMTVPFLRAYSRLLIKTCHRRGIHGIGGMAAQIPNKADPAANEKTMAKVRADKEREVQDGHDGTWVGHPGLVPLAKEIFDKFMPSANQIDRTPYTDEITAAELVKIPAGTITLQGLRDNVSIALEYIEAWLRGQGCVPIRNLMEDAATAEISRVQIWQWIKHPKGVCDDGTRVTLALFRDMLAQETATQRRKLGDEKYRQSKFDDAAALLDRMISADPLPAFLTSEAYALLP